VQKKKKFLIRDQADKLVELAEVSTAVHLVYCVEWSDPAYNPACTSQNSVYMYDDYHHRLLSASLCLR